MSQNEQWKNHMSNSPHVKADGIPNQSLSNSHLEVIHSSTLTPSPPSPMDPVFIAEHHCSAWTIPPFSVGLLPQLCPHPTSCPAPAYTLGWWMGQVGEKRESPKAGGQLLTPS